MDFVVPNGIKRVLGYCCAVFSLRPTPNLDRGVAGAVHVCGREITSFNDLDCE